MQAVVVKTIVVKTIINRRLRLNAVHRESKTSTIEEADGKKADTKLTVENRNRYSISNSSTQDHLLQLL